MAAARATSPTSGSGVLRFFRADSETQRRSFVPVPTVEQVEELVVMEYSMDPKKRYKASIWIHGAICALGAATTLFLIGLLSTGWGTVEVQEGEDGGREVWRFGLWLCCRDSDGLCVGPRWPVYYSVVRSFAVLGLFGHMLSLAWLIGYALEQLLEYDPCGLISFITLTFTTAAMSLIQVSVFGTFWGEDMRTRDFPLHYKGITPSLSYSFYFLVIDVMLVILAGTFESIEMRILINRLDRECDESKSDLKARLNKTTPKVVRRRTNSSRERAGSSSAAAQAQQISTIPRLEYGTFNEDSGTFDSTTDLAWSSDEEKDSLGDSVKISQDYVEAKWQKSHSEDNIYENVEPRYENTKKGDVHLAHDSVQHNYENVGVSSAEPCSGLNDVIDIDSEKEYEEKLYECVSPDGAIITEEEDIYECVSPDGPALTDQPDYPPSIPARQRDDDVIHARQRDSADMSWIIDC